MNKVESEREMRHLLDECGSYLFRSEAGTSACVWLQAWPQEAPTVLRRQEVSEVAISGESKKKNSLTLNISSLTDQERELFSRHRHLRYYLKATAS